VEKEKIIEANREAWNEATDYHQQARRDRLKDGFKDPNFTVFDEEHDGEVIKRLKLMNFKGKKIAQLSCNNGRELLSLVRLGAEEGVGFDISDTAISEGKELAEISNLNVKFERTDILEINNKYNNYFDFIFISEGSLQWIEDVNKYMSVVSRLLKLGGEVLISEMHPFVFLFENGFDFNNGTIDKMNYYFKKGPHKLNESLDYVGGAQYTSKDWYWFMHTMSDIINGILKNDMVITEFEEFNFDKAAGFPKEFQERFPLSFIISAKKVV
jgi:SAM-dependent methyltransferase